MVLETNISLPVFNALKYIVVFSFIDVVVRLCINQLEILYRKYTISRGRSVPLGGIDIDRFRFFSHSLTKATFLSLVLLLISFCTYAIELMLEFSTDSIVRDFSESEVLSISVNNRGICGFPEVSATLAAEYMARIGDICVVYSEQDQEQILYAPVWLQQGDAIFPRCVRTEDNELVREPVPYSDKNLLFLSSSFVDDLRRKSYGSNGDENQEVITVVARNTDIATVRRQEGSKNQTFNTGALLVRIPNSKITCMGNIFGRLGEGQLKAELLFCVRGEWPYNKNTDFLYVSGSGWVPKDAEFITEDWEVKIACTHGREVRDFGNGIVSDDLFSPMAYAAFLGRSFNRDTQSIQRYALVYKYCKLLQIPNLDVVWKQKLVPKAKSVSTSVVQIEEWAVILVVCWPLFLFCLVGLTQCVLRGQELPRHVFGEQGIGKQWFFDVEHKSNSFTSEDEADVQNRPCSVWQGVFGMKKSKNLFLSVAPGETEDVVTITSSPKCIARSTEKPFACVDT